MALLRRLREAQQEREQPQAEAQPLASGQPPRSEEQLSEADQITRQHLSQVAGEEQRHDVVSPVDQKAALVDQYRQTNGE